MNEHEEAARRRKAAELVSHFRARGITVEHLDAMHPDVLAHHVGMAGLRSAPSDLTMSMVRSSMTVLERHETDDPFAGL